MAGTPLEQGLERRRADQARALYGPVEFPDSVLTAEHYLQAARRMRAQTWSAGMHRVWRMLREGLEPLLSPLWRRHRRNVVIRELSSLSDESLRDLGIARSDIPSIAEQMWGPHPSANDDTHHRAA